MINFRNATAALALGLAVAAIATPALAKSRATDPGQAARAQAIEGGIGDETGISPHRAQALRECNDRASSIKSYDTITNQFAIYGSCMMQHREME